MNRKKEIKALTGADETLFFQNGLNSPKQTNIDTESDFENEEFKIDQEYILRLATIVEFSDDAIISNSLEGVIQTWNKGGENMFGYTAEEAIGQNITLIIPLEYRQEEKKILTQICNYENVDIFETVRIKKNGDRFHVTITVSPLKDKEGRITGISKILQENLLISNLKELLYHANQQLAFRNEEKERLTSDLSVANTELIYQNEQNKKRMLELEAVNKELESFSYSVSHDLTAPLRAISGYTQILLEDFTEKLAGKAKKALDSILKNSKRMRQLINDLLAFSQIGKKKLVKSKVEMTTLVHDIVRELQPEDPNRIFNLTVKKLEDISGDRNLLRQVFVNLISNAFKYTGKLKEVSIEIGSSIENDQCIYYVKDNGAGFDMRYYQKLFGVFQRLHSNNEFEGTGIGLSIIQKIINKHGGKVWAEGKVDEGACFYVSLPWSENLETTD